MMNVMLDLETYGNTPGSMILSIGAAAFDDTTGEIDEGLYVVVHRGGQDFGLHRDPGTVDWWRQQSAEARRVITDCLDVATSSPLPAALDTLNAYVRRFGGRDCRVWGNGADFDNAFIASAYRATGRTPPWAFWNNRCYRTLKSFFGASSITRSGTHHNALDDARSQAEHCIRLIKAMQK